MASLDMEDLISYKQATIELGFKSSPQNPKVKQNLFEMFGVPKNPLGTNNKLRFSREKIKRFLAQHIRASKLLSEISDFCEPGSTFINILKTEKITEVINISVSTGSLDYRFVDLEGKEKLLQYFKHLKKIDNCKIVNTSELAEILNLELRMTEKVLEEYTVEPYFTYRGIFYHNDTVQQLLEKQKTMEDKYKKAYCKNADIKKLLNLTDLQTNNWIQNNIPLDLRIEIPNLIKRDKGTYLYPREIVEKELQKRTNKVNVNSLVDDFETFPYEAYLRIKGKEDISFSEKAELTEFYWEYAVKTRLRQTTLKGYDLLALIRRYIKITNLLVSATQQKELFKFSSNELNMMIFNKITPKKWQQELMRFYKTMGKALREQGISFNEIGINYPKRKVKKEQEETIYSFDEYLNLINYCEDIKIHKEKAINNAIEVVNKNKYGSYAEMWVYVILQLNNYWRHVDVVDIPRFVDRKFNHVTFEWLRNNSLSKDDVEYIVNYYKLKIYQHRKNQKERYFILSDDLAEAFAYSILVCECIMKERNSIADNLVNFGNAYNRPTDSLHNFFFSQYKAISQDFVFKNRIANRTLATHTLSVIRTITKRNPIELAKFFRNHSDVDTTNIYVKIPQEHVDKISRQLFDLGNFGFIYSNLAILLFGSDKEGHDIHKENALVIKESFGSAEKVEFISNALLVISEEENYVKDTLSGLSKELLQERYQIINLGLSPSKKEDTQCLVGIENCPMGARDCDNCPLSIPNRFTLCRLKHTVWEKINAFEEVFHSTEYEAEKTKAANHLFFQYNLLRQAVNKFGRNSVNQFVDLDKFNEKFKDLPAFKEHVTLISKE